MTLAFMQALQYLAEEANPSAPGELCHLAMSGRELMQCLGKFTTFTRHDVFEGLANALSGVMVEDTWLSLMGTPLVDSAVSSAMTDIKDTQLSPTETQSVNDPIPPLPVYKPEAKDEDRGIPLADDTTILSAKPKARIKKDLPATRGASPARLEDLVVPTTTFMDNLVHPPILANRTDCEGQECPKWVKVHSSQKVAAVGSVPYKPGEPQQHCNHSSKQCKRA